MLQALEMFGFKSFADRTRFDFAPGVTCIVGPNGSGKSNVVDALKWILGDQSPKSLRGKEMTDVIFNGSANRKPAGLAEATLTFDNSKRILRVDADLVQIGRRIYRSGEAEYLINRVPARLKDVKDLFLGTGAGTSAYSIIEQGRVDQLLQATTLARRVVFEEAAGISRFKVRKIDAQRKLERVAQNLLRLTDIVQEVEGHLQALRSQAAKAAKYREFSQALRNLRIGAAADDFRLLSARLVDVEQSRGALEQDIAQLLDEARDCEARQRLAESQLAEAEDRLRDAERHAAENREAIAGYEATIRHQIARKYELDAEYARLEQQQTDLTARAEQVVGELSQTDVDLQTFADEYERRRATVSGAEQTAHDIGARVSEVRERLDRNRSLLLNAVRQLSVAASRMSALDSQSSARISDQHSIVQRLESLEPALAQCERSFASRSAEVEAVLEQQSQLREQIRALQGQRVAALAAQAATQNKLAELREQRGAIQARRSLLEDLELRQEGLGVGVKEILSLAREASRPPWTHVRGHVVELLEIDLEHAALLEVALGSRAQLVIIDEAQPLLEYLNAGECRIAGRVGFLALAPAPNATRTEPHEAQDLVAIDLTGRVGVVCRADRLVRSASGVPHLPEQLLADTWIVSTLAAAHQLAAQTGARCRYVTLQGELLESNGTLYVGSVRSESSLVSRKSELRGIKADVARLDRRIAAEDDALARGTSELRDAAQAEQHAQFDLDLCSHRVSELRNAANAAELDLERVRRDRTDALAEAERVLAELDQLAPQRAAAEVELARLERAHDELQATIAEDERQIAEDEARQQQLQALSAAEQRDLAKYEERLQNLHQARSRLDQERFQRDLHREEAERRYRLLADKRNQIELEIVNTNAALVELTAQKQVFAGEVERLQRERELARRQRGELADRDLNVRHQLRDLRDQSHAGDMQATEMRHQIANVAERLRDEFQVELTELVATGVSARASLAAEHGSADAEAESPEAATPVAAATADDGQIRAEIEEQINRLRRKIKQLGQVNTDSLNELDELENRFARLSGQLQDLVEAKNTLEEIIRRINAESKRMFIETFEQVRSNFQELFRKLFGGGEGDVVLEDPDDVLECGIDVVARPPGKELRSISLLSGGEKTMTAVALLLAIFKSKPSPFCILDEVDASLDDGNVSRYLAVIHEFRQWTQFIIVSHRKHTMAGADVLYGVTMEEAGVSKRMSVRFEDVSDDGQFRAPPPGAAQATEASEITSAA
ncbi:MAG: chromosome segregation protein SMC [Planctomycetaceae bacterium]|nr:chromosome segregation protein SMC [Planctomycetaceae bacterium]